MRERDLVILSEALIDFSALCIFLSRKKEEAQKLLIGSTLPAFNGIHSYLEESLLVARIFRRSLFCLHFPST